MSASTAASELPFPRFTASARDPFERGFRLGAATAEYVHGSVEVYRKIFAYYTGLAWGEVRARAAAFREPIGDYDEAILREIEGIAAGAKLALDDVLAINARSEIMFGLAVRPPPECTSFYAGPAATSNGHVLLGQNWDWLPWCAGNTVLAEVAQDDRPSFVMLAEGGLVGKIGFNSAGIGVAVNVLLSDLDAGEPAVPVHTILRGILNASTIEDAVAAVVRARRAASANYMIASARGVGVDVETAPGGVDTTFLIHPTNDLLGHSNTFTCNVPFADVNDDLCPDSRVRVGTMLEQLATHHGTLTRGSASALLVNHDGFPNAICRHVEGDRPEAEQASSLASWVIDLTDGVVSIAAGPPCSNSYVTFAPAFRDV